MPIYFLVSRKPKHNTPWFANHSVNTPISRKGLDNLINRNMPDLAVSSDTEIIAKVQKTAEILMIFKVYSYGEQTVGND